MPWPLSRTESVGSDEVVEVADGVRRTSMLVAPASSAFLVVRDEWRGAMNDVAWRVTSGVTLRKICVNGMALRKSCMNGVTLRKSCVDALLLFVLLH